MGQKKLNGLFLVKKFQTEIHIITLFQLLIILKKKKIAKYTSLGKGEILCINSLSFYNTIKKVLAKNPYFLTLKYKENK